MKQFGDNIVATEGDEWKKHRRIANPAFSEVCPFFSCIPKPQRIRLYAIRPHIAEQQARVRGVGAHYAGHDQQRMGERGCARNRACRRHHRRGKSSFVPHFAMFAFAHSHFTHRVIQPIMVAFITLNLSLPSSSSVLLDSGAASHTPLTCASRLGTVFRSKTRCTPSRRS